MDINDAHGHQCTSMDIHGSLSTSMDLHGSLWVSMDLHGPPWTPTEIGWIPWNLVKFHWGQLIIPWGVHKSWVTAKVSSLKYLSSSRFWSQNSVMPWNRRKMMRPSVSDISCTFWSHYDDLNKQTALILPPWQRPVHNHNGPKHASSAKVRSSHSLVSVQHNDPHHPGGCSGEVERWKCRLFFMEIRVTHQGNWTIEHYSGLPTSFQCDQKSYVASEALSGPGWKLWLLTLISLCTMKPAVVP